MRPTLRIAFYTPAAFSAGHHQRITNIVRALHAHDPGIFVHLISPQFCAGSSHRPAPSLRNCATVELPSHFQKGLGDGQIPSAEEEWAVRQQRTDIAAARKLALTTALEGIAFQVLVIESFPFLTQQETDEIEHLLALVRATSPRARIFFSVRDVLYGRRVSILDAEAKSFAERFVRRHATKLLVHGDPTLIRFEESYGDATGLEDLLVYTGIVVRPKPSVADAPRGRHVVCSVGGRRQWRTPTVVFLQAWQELRRTNGLPPDTRTYIFTGIEEPGDVFWQLLEQYRESSETQPMPLQVGSWDDYPKLAASAACSVSQCGYNTAYELLSWQVPAILMPRPHDGPDRDAEGEHSLRARKIAAKGWARIATTRDQLIREIVGAFHSPAPRRPALQFDGAERTARILLQCAEAC